MFKVLVQFAKKLPKAPIKIKNFSTAVCRSDCSSKSFHRNKLPYWSSLVTWTSWVSLVLYTGSKDTTWGQFGIAITLLLQGNTRHTLQSKVFRSVFWYEKKYREVFCRRTFRKKYYFGLAKNSNCKYGVFFGTSAGDKLEFCVTSIKVPRPRDSCNSFRSKNIFNGFACRKFLGNRPSSNFYAKRKSHTQKISPSRPQALHGISGTT